LRARKQKTSKEAEENLQGHLADKLIDVRELLEMVNNNFIQEELTKA
jgi:hypothetical protein